MNRDEIPIASPCSADWTTMTLQDQGRFCDSCRKVVYDLERMSEPEALALLASPQTEGLCVRFVHDATGEIVFRRELTPRTRIRRTAAMVVAASVALTMSACCMGAVRPQPPPHAIKVDGQTPSPRPER
jgi:hypothetical protein